RVLIPLRPLPERSGDEHAELGAQVVRDVFLPSDDLDDPARIAQVDEDDAAMVPAPRYPARERDLLPGRSGTQRASLVRADHLCQALLQNLAGHRPVAGPDAGASPARNGLKDRSAPIVVCGP